VDWTDWMRRCEAALGAAEGDAWQRLFASAGIFSDPHTRATTDLDSIARQTRSLFPDWSQEVVSLRPGDGWAVFEWIGRGTYSGPGAPPEGAPVVLEGATVVEVDATGLVTRWRDYLDRRGVEDQVRAAHAGRGQSG